MLIFHQLAALASLKLVLDEFNRANLIFRGLNMLTSEMSAIITQAVVHTKSQGLVTTLDRGVATIPLPGIDIPFHSTMLRNGVAPFRNLLRSKIRKENVDPKKLVGKYIPNLTGTPFSLSRGYIESVAIKTGSKILWEMLDKVSYDLA